MSEDRLPVIFGTGQVGRALAARLAGMGITVRAVSRHRPPALTGVDWRAANAADPEAAADAAKGASVIYQCLNAPYSQWPELFPPLQRGVLTAAERTGALLVSPSSGLLAPRWPKPSPRPSPGTGPSRTRGVFAYAFNWGHER